MTLTVNTNISALSAQLNLSRSSTLLNRSLERLSTGLRINRSSDDPSGLVISEFQRAQISGLSQAVRNIDRAISLAQTAEGGLAEINALLVELRSLAVDSANNGALDRNGLEANQANVENIIATIDRISATTRFGSLNLLDGSSGISGVSTDAAITFLTATDPGVVPAGNAPLPVVITANAERAFRAAPAAQGAVPLAQDETLIINGVEIQLDAGLNQAAVIDEINQFSGQTGVVAFNNAGVTTLRTELFGDTASVSVVSNRANLAGSTRFGQAVLTDVGQNVAGTINGAAATGQGEVLTGDGGANNTVSIRLNITNVNDTATTAPALGAAIVLIDNSRTFQIGAFADTDPANPQNRATLTLNTADSSAIGIGILGSRFPNLNAIDVRTPAGANDAIILIDRAIAEVSNQRGTIGAFQTNTLESTQSNVRTQLINLQDAESSLRDTDFTTEITAFVSEQIRQQVATTTLGLANQSALAILNLLQNQQA